MLSTSTQEGILTTCIVLQAVGVVGCIILFLTAIFSNTVQRHTSWLNFIFSWIPSGLSYLLLLLTGNMNNLNPPFGICVTQAALIYAAPVLTATTTLFLVTQVYFNVRNMLYDNNTRAGMTQEVLLLVLPYIFFAIMTVGVLTLGLKEPGTVRRVDLQSPYCSMANRIPSRVASIFVASTLIPTLILELVICATLRKEWSLLRRQRLSITTALRVLAFSFFGLVVIGISVVFAASSNRDPEFNIIISFLPTAAFIVFGSQKDVIQAWMFWGKRDSVSDNEADNSRTELTRTR